MNNLIYCKDCKDWVEHIPKLDAIKHNKMVCKSCRRTNPIVLLTKPFDESFIKISSDFTWIKWGEGDRFKDRSDVPVKDSSLILAPFSKYFTWMTTPIMEILEESNGLIKFRTVNSTYELKFPKK